MHFNLTKKQKIKDSFVIAKKRKCLFLGENMKNGLVWKVFIYDFSSRNIKTYNVFDLESLNNVANEILAQEKELA